MYICICIATPTLYCVCYSSSSWLYLTRRIANVTYHQRLWHYNIAYVIFVAIAVATPTFYCYCYCHSVHLAIAIATGQDCNVTIAIAIAVCARCRSQNKKLSEHVL